MGPIPKGYVTPFFFILFILVILVYFMRWYIPALLKKGKELPEIRKLAAVEAIEEAVGRCTEMGKPICIYTAVAVTAEYAPIGLATAVICNYAARLAVRNDVPVIYAAGTAVLGVYIESQLAEIYSSEGKSDAFDPSYSVRVPAAGGSVGGISTLDNAAMIQWFELERPAADVVFVSNTQTRTTMYEAGARLGMIQIGGDYRTVGIPFAVAATDQFLMGEELFAAAAYINKEPKIVGNLVGTDIIKIAIVVVYVVGTILISLGSSIIKDWLAY